MISVYMPMMVTTSPMSTDASHAERHEIMSGSYRRMWPARPARRERRRKATPGPQGDRPRASPPTAPLEALRGVE